MSAESQRETSRARMIDVCAGLPGVTVEEGRHVGFSVRGKRFAWLLDDHHGDGRLALNCKAPPGECSARVEANPDRFFVPAYLGARGWLGLWLDTGAVDWDEVELVVLEAYLLVAPKKLAAQLFDGTRSARPG